MDTALENPVFVFGYPADVGGANTELWHTLKLWRTIGLEVNCIPTWEPKPGWRERVEGIGCRTIEATAETVDRIPGLRGNTVVAFCNPRFLSVAHRVRKLGCPIVWAGCMAWLLAGERRHYRRHRTFDRYIFQSEYQRSKLEPGLQEFGYRPEQGRLIRGAFDLTEFPFRFRPHGAGEPFVVGRISRAAAEKFTGDSWNLYRQVPGCMARLLGFGPAAEAVAGPPPEWAQCLPAGAVPSRDFLAALHAFVMPTACMENWPRVGLEAMAAGVPLVVDNRGGWREMIQHGETGFLCDCPGDFVRHATALATDDTLRLRIARAARESVLQLADPAAIGAAWLQVFNSI